MSEIPRVGVRQMDFPPDDFHRSTVRLIYDPSRYHVYIEVTSKHDGHNVSNAHRMDRAAFVARLREMGVL